MESACDPVYVPLHPCNVPKEDSKKVPRKVPRKEGREAKVDLDTLVLIRSDPIRVCHVIRQEQLEDDLQLK